MFRSPSGVSRQIQDLATELGTPLLEPVGRNVRLTAAARVLVDYADASAARWERVRAEVERTRAEGGGTLAIAAYPTALAALAAPLIAAMETRHRCLVSAVEAQPEEAFSLVMAGTVDLAIVVATDRTPPRSNPRYGQRRLIDEPIDLLVPAGHPLAEDRTVELVQAAHLPWIVPREDQDGYNEIMTVCAAGGFTPEIAHRARDWTAVGALVAAGCGVSLASRLAALPQAADIARVPVTGTPSPTGRCYS